MLGALAVKRSDEVHRYNNNSVINSAMYDMDCLDPDWKLAQLHGKACSPGLPLPHELGQSEVQELQGREFCSCCLNIIHKKPIPLCENTKQLDFLGFGFPLYFIFNKYNIILLLLQIASYSALSLYWAYQANHDLCDEGEQRELPGGYHGVCTSWLIRFVRTQSNVSTSEAILRACSFVIHLLGLAYTRDTINKTRNYYDERTTLISDYAVILHNIPRETETEQKIKRFLGEAFPGKCFQAKDLVLFNILEDYQHIREEKRGLLAKKRKFLSHPLEYQRQIAEIDGKLQEKEEELEHEYQKQVRLIAEDNVICEKAIIVLNSEEIRNELLAEFEKVDQYKLIDYFGVEGIDLEMAVAPEPREIIWENINYGNKRRVLRLFLGWTMTLATIGVITGIFYVILHAKSEAVEKSIAKTHHSEDPDEIARLNNVNLAGTLLTMVAITLFNKFIFSYILHHFTDVEMHRTGGEYEFSFGLKYTLGLFFTTALMTLFVEDLSFHNIYSEQYGVVEEESIMFFLNAFFIPLIWVVHPWQIVHLIKRRCNYGRSDITQKEANDLMEDSKYSVGKKYAQTIESVWFTYFYASLIPGGAVVMLVGFCFFYWVDKVVLLRRSSINPNVNASLSVNSMKLIEVSLVLRCAGEIFFDLQLREGGTTWLSILCLCVGVVYVFAPTDDIINFFHEEKFKPEERLYQEVKDTFIEDYRNIHPLFLRERDAKARNAELVSNERVSHRFDFHPHLPVHNTALVSESGANCTEEAIRPDKEVEEVAVNAKDKKINDNTFNFEE